MIERQKYFWLRFLVKLLLMKLRKFSGDVEEVTRNYKFIVKKKLPHKLLELFRVVCVLAVAEIENG